MVSYRLIAAAGMFASVYALPLNINLGAYSPALVVGDGEISFGNGQDVSKLFNTLEGAAQSAAGAAAAAPAVAAPAAAVPATAAGTAAGTGTAAGAGTAAAAPKAESVSISSTPVSDTAAPAADSTLQEQASAISTLQGMGKEIAPREPVAKRDLASFDRALKFAEAALTKGPVVQLGTGKTGAGVGIIVDNRPAAAAGGAAKAAAKRSDESSQPRRRTTKVTTMYVRRGVPTELQTSKSETRDTQSLPVAARSSPAGVETREPSSSSTIDAINLNVDDPQGITMTFVETSEEGSDDDE